MLEMTNKSAYCCKCVHRLDRNVIYSQMYIRFRGTQLGYMLHLDDMIAKDKNYFVCSCIKCIAEMVLNLTVTLPNFCKSDVCVSFSRCYSRILYMLEDIKVMNLKSALEVANYSKFRLTREDICNKCLNCLFIIIKRVFNAFCFRWILINFVESLKIF